MSAAEKLGSDAVGVPLGPRTHALHVHAHDEKDPPPTPWHAIFWIAAVATAAEVLGIVATRNANPGYEEFGPIVMALGVAGYAWAYWLTGSKKRRK